MKGWNLLLLTVAVLLLVGCAVPAETPVETPAAAVSEPEPLPVEKPETPPPQEPVSAPEPEPEPEPEIGPAVTVDGTRLSSGSRLFEEEVCVCLFELTEALGET